MPYCAPTWQLFYPSFRSRLNLSLHSKLFLVEIIAIIQKWTRPDGVAVLYITQ